MAVKTSWAAGDVLLAADLTDTFAAKAPTASPTFTGNVVWSGATLRAATAEVATSQTTSSATYTDLATSGPAVTVTTGTKALVIIGGSVTANASGNAGAMSFAVSGATTVSASDSYSLVNYNPNTMRASRAILLTGLTAGSNTFTAKYKRWNASDGSFENRTITVIDMGS